MQTETELIPVYCRDCGEENSLVWSKVGGWECRSCQYIII